MQIKAFIPRSIKRPLRGLHRAHTFQLALRDVDQLLVGTHPSNDDLSTRLVYGWSNEGWSAKPHLITYLVDNYRGFSGTMLECGSGLSTLIMGLIAKRTGATILSLEHSAEWYGTIQTRLRAKNVDPKGVLLAPLKDFGDYCWYSVPEQIRKKGSIDLMLCDGPPNNTPGGRYGLLPQMRDCLAPGAQIIVDDSQRSEEVRMISLWMSENPGLLEVQENFDTFTVLRVRQ